MDVRNKRVVVTGASGGIGQQLCSLLAAEGALLVLNGTNESALQELQKNLGPQHAVIAADISAEQGRAQLVQRSKELGGVDVLINLAGVLDCNWLIEQSVPALERMLTVNLLGPVLLTRELLPQLLRKPSARIVNVGSIFGSIGHPGFVAYCSSKAGVKMFSEALARELAQTKVSVGYIAPRATRTPLNSERVVELNKAMGNAMDEPLAVAKEIVKFIKSESRLRYLGWPESLFVRVNALLPQVVHNALVGKLAVLKKILG